MLQRLADRLAHFSLASHRAVCPNVWPPVDIEAIPIDADVSHPIFVDVDHICPRIKIRPVVIEQCVAEGTIVDKSIVRDCLVKLPQADARIGNHLVLIVRPIPGAFAERPCIQNKRVSVACVVGRDVENDFHPKLVSAGDKILEILCGSILRCDGEKVHNFVSRTRPVIDCVVVLHDRHDPDDIVPHRRNAVKVGKSGVDRPRSSMHLEEQQIHPSLAHP